MLSGSKGDFFFTSRTTIILEVSNNGKACNYSGKNEDNINNKILEVFKIKESILANNPKELESLRKSCRDYVYDYLKEQGTLPKDTLSSETGAKTGIGRKVVD